MYSKSIGMRWPLDISWPWRHCMMNNNIRFWRKPVEKPQLLDLVRFPNQLYPTFELRNLTTGIQLQLHIMHVIAWRREKLPGKPARILPAARVLVFLSTEIAEGPA